MAKVAFLIGLLFLSGGVFYFFASGFNVSGNSSATQGIPSSTGTSSTTSAASPTSATSATSTTTSSSVTASTESTTSSASTLSTTSSTSQTTTTSATQSVTMQTPSCPSRVTAGQTFTCTITIFNQASTTFSSASVVSGQDFSEFTFVGCTEVVNGVSAGSVPVTSNTIAVGNLAPGSTVLTLSVQAPSQSGQYSKSVLTLSAPGLSPISVTFGIQVTA